MEWDFGDGSTSTDQLPSHRYTIAGAYTIQLTVSGPGGADTSIMPDFITIDPGPPVNLEVTPPTVTLAVQEGTQFTAVARDEFENVVPRTLTWAMHGEGGSITENGLFTANTEAGTFTDTVAASLQTESGELVGSASVTVVPGPLSRVVVEPAVVALDIGATQSFSFKAFDAFDNETTDVIAAWTVPPDMGVIDANGSLAVGTKAGPFFSAVRLEAVEGTTRVSASVDVLIRPDPLFSVDIGPSFAVIRPGASQRFTATGLDFFGNPIPGLAFVWETTDGVIELIDARTADFHGGAPGSRYELKASALFRNSTRTGTALVGIPPGWMPAGNMAESRRDHAAVLLDDGTVLIVGGTKATAELYDPATQRFTHLGSVPFRQGVRATRLADGNVLVVGEGGNAPGRTVMIYNPVTRQFKLTGSLNVARGYSSLTLFPDGKVLVTGGQERAPGGTVAVAEEYDPATGIFTLTGSLNAHRRLHAAVLLPNGKVLVVGGDQTTRPGYGTTQDIAELYDPAVGEFSVVGKIVVWYASAVLLNDGKVLVWPAVGGQPTEVFDPVTNSFSSTADMITNHGSGTATLLQDGTVMVAGGGRQPGVELYDPVIGRFSSHSSLPEARQQHTATLLPAGRVLIIGGTVPGSEDLRSALIYVP